MSFNTPAATRSNVSRVANEDWKSQAFVNIYLPTPEGGKRKLGSIPLKDSKKYDAAMITRLSEGGEEALAAFKSAVLFDFKLADSPGEAVLGF